MPSHIFTGVHGCMFPDCQAYHKLFQLESLVRGDDPVVTMDGERREFIMQIRTGMLTVLKSMCRSVCLVGWLFFFFFFFSLFSSCGECVYFF